MNDKKAQKESAWLETVRQEAVEYFELSPYLLEGEAGKVINAISQAQAEARERLARKMAEEEAMRLIAASSFGLPEVDETLESVSDEEAVALVSRVAEAERKRSGESLPSGVGVPLEEWLGAEYSTADSIFRLARSYARDGFLRRAEVCLRAAVGRGIPQAEQELETLLAGYGASRGTAGTAGATEESLSARDQELLARAFEAESCGEGERAVWLLRRIVNADILNT